MAHEGQDGVIIQSGDYQLLGTFFRPPGESLRPTAVILHGIPGIEKNYDLAHHLRDAGWNSLIFHYRGCWGSAGCYHLPTIPSDVNAAVRALKSGEFQGVDPDKVVLIGHSLGGWAAVLAAYQNPDVRAVCTISLVANITEFHLADPSYAAEYTPWLTGIPPEELASQWRSLGRQYSPLHQVALIAPRPLLVLHGGRDPVLPQKHSEELYNRAGSPKDFLVHPEANHSFTWHRAWLKDQLLVWLRNLTL